MYGWRRGTRCGRNRWYRRLGSWLSGKVGRAKAHLRRARHRPLWRARRFAALPTPRRHTFLRLRDELLVHIHLEAFDAALVAVTGILDTAERRLGRRDRHAVDADHTGLQRIADRGRGLRRRR